MIPSLLPGLVLIGAIFCLYESHSVMLTGYSWLGLEGPYGMLEIEARSARCKANVLPDVLLPLS